MDELNLEFAAVGQLLGDRYLVTRKLGEGGMGILYLAKDQRAANRDVVLKFPKKSLLYTEGFLARFEKEVASLIEFEHPAVIRVYDVARQGDAPYMVQQYMPGGSLQDRITQQDALSPSDVLQFLPRLAEALDSLHKLGLIHRDVKAGNILFDRFGHSYLSDFGIAKILSELDQSLTGSGVALGSPESLAPEFNSKAPLTPAYDQYGLATAVYQALCGRLPFEYSTLMDIQLAVITQQPVPIIQRAPNISPAFSDAVMKALSKRPTERFANCTAFVKALDSSLNLPHQDRVSAIESRPEQDAALEGRRLDANEVRHEPPRAGEPPADEDRNRKQRRKRFAFGLAAVAALISLVIASRPTHVPQATSTDAATQVADPQVSSKEVDLPQPKKAESTAPPSRVDVEASRQRAVEVLAKEASSQNAIQESAREADDARKRDIEKESRAFNAVSGSRNSAAYRDFLAHFPDGPHSHEITGRLARCDTTSKFENTKRTSEVSESSRSSGNLESTACSRADRSSKSAMERQCSDMSDGKGRLTNEYYEQDPKEVVMYTTANTFRCESLGTATCAWTESTEKEVESCP